MACNLRQSVPLRDTTFCSKHFLSCLEFIIKVLFDRLSICPSLWMLQTDFRLCRNGLHVGMVYMSEWSTCRPLRTRFFGCLLVFRVYYKSPFDRLSICPSSLWMRQTDFRFPYEVFWLLRWERLNSEIYAYHPWAGHYCQLSTNYEVFGSFLVETIFVEQG